MNGELEHSLLLRSPKSPGQEVLEHHGHLVVGHLQVEEEQH